MQSYIEGRSGSERVPSLRGGGGVWPAADQSDCGPDHDHDAGWHDRAHVGLFLRCRRERVNRNVRRAESVVDNNYAGHLVAGGD
jgi:hypothetical protein